MGHNTDQLRLNTNFWHRRTPSMQVSVFILDIRSNAKRCTKFYYSHQSHACALYVPVRYHLALQPRYTVPKSMLSRIKTRIRKTLSEDRSRQARSAVPYS